MPSIDLYDHTGFEQDPRNTKDDLLLDLSGRRTLREEVGWFLAAKGSRFVPYTFSETTQMVPFAGSKYGRTRVWRLGFFGPNLQAGCCAGFMMETWTTKLGNCAMFFFGGVFKSDFIGVDDGFDRRLRSNLCGEATYANFDLNILN